MPANSPATASATDGSITGPLVEFSHGNRDVEARHVPWSIAAVRPPGSFVTRL